MRISDWSSDVCSSDLLIGFHPEHCQLEGDGPVPDNAYHLQVQVEQVEELGADALVYGVIGTGDAATNVIVKVPERKAPMIEVGRTVSFYVPWSLIRRFDAQTGISKDQD